MYSASGGEHGEQLVQTIYQSARAMRQVQKLPKIVARFFGAVNEVRIVKGQTMENFADDILVADVAREVVSEIAPHEMPIFVAASRAYFKDPDTALHENRAKDAPIGFGLAELAVLVTPVVLRISSEVFEFLIDVARNAMKDGLAKEVPQLVKAMFKKYQESQPDVPAILTREQVGRIHANVLVTAKNLRLPADKAKSLANAIIAQLVLPKGESID